MKKHVFLFQRDFVPKILNGTKRTTIRPLGSRIVWAGDKMDMRFWSDKPYRSKQVKFADAICIESTKAVIEDCLLPSDRAALFAREDGFDSWNDLLDWFRKAHGLPFTGTLYRWKPTELIPLITLEEL